MAEADSTDPRTVFIKGISFDWDNSDFEKAVSDVGPVRKCFLLKGAGKHHKGCGFVTFALQEDAQRAVDELSGKKLGGRTIQVEAAQRRAPFEERKEKKRKRTGDAPATTDEAPTATAAAALPSSPQQPPAAAEAAASPAAEPKPRKPKKQRVGQRPAEQKQMGENAKHALVRTVALGNLSAGNREQALAYALSDTGAHSVVQPSQADLDSHVLQRDGCAGNIVFLVYPTVKGALAAVEKLHNHVLQEGDGGAAGARGRKSKAGESSGTLLWARQVSGEGAHLKKWRLILRNLPFNVKEADLRELLSPAGFVWELTVPRNPDGKARGFGFAGFMCRAHAERAIKLANAKVVGGRTIAVDWAVPKAQFQQNASAEAPAAEEDPTHAENTISDDDDADSAEEEAARASEQQDEVASEVQLEDEKKLLRSVLSQIDDGDDDETPQAKVKAARKAAKGEEESQPQRLPEVETQPKEAAAAGREAAAAGGETSAAERKDAVQATVFVRGLPLDVLQYEVHERLSRFGKLKACRLVQDKGTKKLKGTAFVEFEQQSDARAAADACVRARAGQGAALTVRGSPIEVDLALTQDDARQLAGATKAQPGGKDNRNLYLLKEGQIEEGSPAWQAMSVADRAKRKRAAGEARTKLKSPNYFLSRTRLCLRNLPAKLNEKALKDLVLAAVKERAAKAQPIAKQVKILRDTEKAGADGQAASKGLGFVELTEHEHALCALRQLNNNPVPFGTERRPVVEFAIENAQTLKKREIRRRSINTEDARGPKGASSAEAAADGAVPAEGAEQAASKRKPRKRKREEKSAAQVNARIKSGIEAGTSGQTEGAAIPAVSSAPAQQSKRRKRELRAAARKPLPKQKKRAQRDDGGFGQPKGRNRQKPNAEKADKLDSLVTQYKAQLFGEGAGKGAKGSIKSSMQRWFE
ncbi:hypothetical protein WJX75_001025 [Coccomyxa subellipsoidea]|uniref:RRM domain-containing protein n=1 Tax=Coccomyxa subellipsoidea TaxID=248742 RepID=A0ABR2YKB2_9CHLO